jgi:spermidine/putrescine transport system permease protein
MVGQNSILKTIVTRLVFALGLAFIYLPIFVMILHSFFATEGFSLAHFTLRWYGKMLNSSQMMSALQNSLLIATITTLLSVSMSSLLVMGSIWYRPRWIYAIFQPSAILPEIILAIGLLTFFAFAKVRLGMLSLIIGHSIIGLGISIPIIKNAVSHQDPLLVEAAMDMGASRPRVLIDVVIPEIKASFAYAAFLVFTLSLDDFFIAYFCSGSGVWTISTFVYSQIKALPDPSLNALSTILLFFSSATVFGVVFLRNIFKRRDRT